jgi:hypothetical protein
VKGRPEDTKDSSECKINFCGLVQIQKSNFNIFSEIQKIGKELMVEPRKNFLYINTESDHYQRDPTNSECQINTPKKIAEASGSSQAPGTRPKWTVKLYHGKILTE